MQGPYSRARLSGAQLPRVTTASVSTATAESAPAVACPRCQGALSDPRGACYCLRCGYCRSIEETAPRSPAAQPLPEQANEPRPVTFWRALSQLPDSFWVILLATLAVLPLCYFADHHLGAGSRTRIIWSFAQIAAGFVIIYAAQVWAYFLLRARNEPVGFADTLFPANLWRLTFHALPETGSPLALCGCGGVVILTGVFWIGTWNWLLVVDPTADMPTTFVTEENTDFRQDYKKLKEAANSARPDQNVPAKPKPVGKETLTDTRPAAQCVVIGYLPDKDGRVTGLVLATLRDGKLTYAGTVTDGIGKEQSSGLWKKLTTLTTNTPLLGDLDVKAVWVRPEVFCEVQQSGANPKGLLIEPRFKALIED